MSATLHSEALAAHLDCPVLTVPGRLHEVTEHYLPEAHALISATQLLQSRGGRDRIVTEDLLRPAAAAAAGRKGKKGGAGGKGGRGAGGRPNMSLNGMCPPHFDAELTAEFLIRLIQKESIHKKTVVGNRDEEGDTTRHNRGQAVLVFLPGIQAIENVNRILRARRVLDELNAFVCILHSTVPPAQQKRAFVSTSPGQWKIVLSTNIAESSVTVNDVTHVVDCGLVKEMRFEPSSGISSLRVCHASVASMQQRKGRAGAYVVSDDKSLSCVVKGIYLMIVFVRSRAAGRLLASLLQGIHGEWTAGCIPTARNETSSS